MTPHCDVCGLDTKAVSPQQITSYLSYEPDDLFLGLIAVCNACALRAWNGKYYIFKIEGKLFQSIDPP